ncbi:MAG TPA: glycosyl hydrolase [Solirubrobacteraceae bacterium]|nr:glycosyl hydrolase [Solirubrobacteraceae bacterium]
MFTDPRFLALGLTTARRSVAWDTFEYDWQIAEVDEWLVQARAAGVRPLITFNRSRIDAKRHVIPTRAQWLAGFTEFRRRYPWVTDFVASNESNHTPPTVKRPRLAAQYYRDMRRACRTCRIAAATINERPQRKYMEGWIRRFVKTARHRPRYWALHNYYGANTFSLKGTKRFLKATRRGEVWITEVGGLVARRSAGFAGKLKMKEGLAHAQRATRFIFDRILTVSPRIKRVYLYHWDSAGATDTWDSAFVSPNGAARRTLDIVESKLKAKPKPKKPRRRR